MQLGFDNNTSEIFLNGTPQTLSYTLDELLFADGNVYSTLAEYQAGAWADFTQIQVQIQAQGDQFDVGIDADNIIRMDNVVITAPFETIDNGGNGDFNGDAVYDCADIDALIGEDCGGNQRRDLRPHSGRLGRHC